MVVQQSATFHLDSDEIMNECMVRFKKQAHKSNILLSKWIRIEEAVLLKTLIAEHHKFFLKLFHINLRPKQHHMVHYPMIIQESGPLSLFWCMRFEAKHRVNRHCKGYKILQKHTIYSIVKTSIKIGI
ncbi:Uncharacterized protein FWK35_00025294 [Aphis craccivora]|uniref:Uncharacterized protein n=1 Tax=Aphis craccivora TaxID=307492 RepID=A0A6G0W2W4_APHCR|nr:Uncharacterized protein FWK35_00025294 [Aphis craccivora]